MIVGFIMTFCLLTIIFTWILINKKISKDIEMMPDEDEIEIEQDKNSSQQKNINDIEEGWTN